MHAVPVTVNQRPGTVPALLAARAAADPDRVAIDVVGGRPLTFGAWHSAAVDIRQVLRERGIRPGSRVVVGLGASDWVDFATVYCGVLRAGAIAVPCGDRLPPSQLRHIVQHCAASALIGADDRLGGAGHWTATPADLAGYRRGGGQLTESADPDGLARPGDLAQILYTAGTTGEPKAVAATHANLTADTATHPRRRRLAHSAHFLHAFPIGTNAAQTMLLNALDAAAAALVLPRFTPRRFIGAAQHYRAGTAFIVPAMATELLRSGALDDTDLTFLQLLGCTAAPLAPAVAARLAERLPGTTIVNYYTSTEAAPAQVSMVYDGSHPGAVGRPPDGLVEIRDGTGAVRPPGEVGDVWLRSAHPRSYYGDEGSRDDTFRGGWVRMGDLGRLDDAGYLHLLDRTDDIIKSGADKVSTLRVEAALHEYPGVSEAAVVGVPHEVLGLSVVAALVLGGPTVDLAALRAFLRQRLADHELPATVVVLDRLPRNPGGKVVKRELRRLLTIDPHRREATP